MSIPELHYRQFLPLGALADLKARSGLRVSLVIPALNEAPTIGDIIARCHRELVDDAPLLDEILLIDGDSTDGTAGIAARAGAVVHRAADIMPERQLPPGKGTSMWKSLAVATGDILVFIDADIVDFRTHFVYALAGTLLRDPTLLWAKAFYRRPFIAGAGQMEGYGGRVTEILVRPLLCGWYPELARIRQPLSGECAFRRTEMAQLPFTSGYGVELQLLLGMYRRHGLSRFAQVDMDVRLHRNRPVAQLGRMSLAILRTFYASLREDGLMGGGTEPGSRMVSWTPAGCIESTLDEVRLPPAATLPGAARA
jgi:glucosyl-3-phosphoglycerate synthase